MANPSLNFATKYKVFATNHSLKGLAATIVHVFELSGGDRLRLRVDVWRAASAEGDSGGRGRRPGVCGQSR